MRNWRYREVKELAQGHTAGKSLYPPSNLGRLEAAIKALTGIIEVALSVLEADEKGHMGYKLYPLLQELLAKCDSVLCLCSDSNLKLTGRLSFQGELH